MEKKNPETQNIDKEAMHSNNQTISFVSDRFIFDFKEVYPQFDSQGNPLTVVNHKTILMDPFSCKEFIRNLKNIIREYETENGLIRIPESLKRARKKKRKVKVTSAASIVDKHKHYIG